MLFKWKNWACTSLAAMLVLAAVGISNSGCPVIFYQPELPNKN
jgi:cyclic lactone autoinducer peptide